MVYDCVFPYFLVKCCTCYVLLLLVERRDASPQVGFVRLRDWLYGAEFNGEGLDVVQNWNTSEERRSCHRVSGTCRP